MFAKTRTTTRFTCSIDSKPQYLKENLSVFWRWDRDVLDLKNVDRARSIGYNSAHSFRQLKFGCHLVCQALLLKEHDAVTQFVELPCGGCSGVQLVIGNRSCAYDWRHGSRRTPRKHFNPAYRNTNICLTSSLVVRYSCVKKDNVWMLFDTARSASC